MNFSRRGFIKSAAYSIAVASSRMLLTYFVAGKREPPRHKAVASVLGSLPGGGYVTFSSGLTVHPTLDDYVVCFPRKNFSRAQGSWATARRQQGRAKPRNRRSNIRTADCQGAGRRHHWP